MSKRLWGVLLLGGLVLAGGGCGADDDWLTARVDDGKLVLEIGGQCGPDSYLRHLRVVGADSRVLWEISAFKPAQATPTVTVGELPAGFTEVPPAGPKAEPSAGLSGGPSSRPSNGPSAAPSSGVSAGSSSGVSAGPGGGVGSGPVQIYSGPVQIYLNTNFDYAAAVDPGELADGEPRAYEPQPVWNELSPVHAENC